MKRRAMSQYSSRKSFRRGSRVHPKNNSGHAIMRGGIRL